MARRSGKTADKARRRAGHGSPGAGKPRASAAKPAKGKHPRIRAFFKWTAVAGVWGTIALAGLLGWYATDLPNVDKALAPRHQPTIWVVAANGATIGTAGDLHGVPVRLSDVPPALPHALIAVEDRRFYEHFGLDPIGMLRALVADIRAGRIVQGGSTLTQQVAKNLFLGPQQTLKRKIQEAMLALWLEHRFTKNQILTIYLNRVYFGSGTYGVDAAARKYFGKPVGKLSLWECAMLAGMVQAPSRLNPIANPSAAEARTKIVLHAMVEAGYLTAAQAAHARKSLIRGVQRKRPGRLAPHFVDWVVAQADQYIGPTDRDLVIQTTLDPTIQRAAEHALLHTLDGVGAKRKVGEGAVLVMTPKGAIKAMVGGRNWKKSQFNRATMAHRQPGSAFKPVVFLSALENGISPDSTVLDAPITIGNWKPQDFESHYAGNVTLTYALAHSLNTAAVRLAQKVGVARIREQAKRLGLDSNLPDNLSIALGSGETTLLDLTSAYAAFDNDGVGVFPYAIKEIRDTSGAILYQRRGSGPGRVAPAAATAELVGMMRQVVETGTGRAAALPGRQVAGKTGTSQNFRDAWFVGFTSHYVGGVWMGNDDGSPMKRVTGGSLPAEVWHQVMATANQGLPAKPLIENVPGRPIGSLVSQLWSILKPDSGGGTVEATASSDTTKKKRGGGFYQPGNPGTWRAPN